MRACVCGGGIASLACGWACQTAVMMLWNWLVAPIYMGYLREAVEALLLMAFLPLQGGRYEETESQSDRSYV